MFRPVEASLTQTPQKIAQPQFSCLESRSTGCATEKREDERREIAMHERLPEALLGRLSTRKWEEPEETQGLRSAPLQRQLTVDKQPDGTR